MSDDEFGSIFRLVPERRRGPRTFRLGDSVRVLSGPFASFAGRVEGINQTKGLLKVRVTIFGRGTALRLRFADAEVVDPPRGG